MVVGVMSLLAGWSQCQVGDLGGGRIGRAGDGCGRRFGGRCLFPVL